MKSKENGITLLVLVITIIVIIILAAVTLTITIGDEGIVQLTENTITLYNEVTEKEQNNINDFVQNFNEILSER